MRERYRIGLDAVAGCIVDRPLLDYVDAYNTVADDAAKQKFHHDVFKDVAEDASRAWRVQHPKQ